jgi:hypothetical protein
MRNPGIKQLLVICSLILPFACTKKTGSPTQENQSEKQSTETAAAPAGPQKITQNAYSPSNPFSVSRDQEGRISQITFPYGQVVTYQYKDQERFPNQKIIKGLFCDAADTSCKTEATFTSNDPGFYFSILDDMSRRLKSIPSMLTVLENEYENFKKSDLYQDETPEQFVLEVFNDIAVVILGKIKENGEGDQDLEDKIQSETNVQTFWKLLLEAELLDRKTFAEKRNDEVISSDPEDILSAGFTLYIDRIMECNRFVGEKIKTLLSEQKIKGYTKSPFGKDIAYPVTYIISPEENYMAFPIYTITGDRSSMEVDFRDTSRRYKYWSDKNFDESFTVENEADAYMTNIIHEYGHLRQFSEVAMVNKNFEETFLVSMLTSKKKSNSTTFSTKTIYPNILEPMGRIMESGAQFFTLDSQVSCLLPEKKAL